MSTRSRMEQLIVGEASRLGYSLQQVEAERLARFVEILSHWSARIRLTGSAEPRVLISKHLPDSFALAAALPQGEGSARCVDVGAGGGLPGMPCALLRPELDVSFVEANGRKCSFLRTAAFELSVTCQVIEQRIESLSLAGYDVVWSRATFAPGVWAGHAAQMLRPGGLAVLFTARGFGEPATDFERFAERAYELQDGTPRVLTVLRRT